MKVNKIEIFNVSTISDDGATVDDKKFDSILSENYDNFNKICNELESFNKIKNFKCNIDFESKTISFVVNGDPKKLKKNYDFKF